MQPVAPFFPGSLFLIWIYNQKYKKQSACFFVSHSPFFVRPLWVENLFQRYCCHENDAPKADVDMSPMGRCTSGYDVLHAPMESLHCRSSINSAHWWNSRSITFPGFSCSALQSWGWTMGIVSCSFHRKHTALFSFSIPSWLAGWCSSCMQISAQSCCCYLHSRWPWKASTFFYGGVLQWVQESHSLRRK